MKQLKKIVQTLSSKERKSLESYYDSNGSSKRKKLLNLIHSNPDWPSSRLKKAIYSGNGKASSFGRLKSRLREDVLNIIWLRNQDGDLLPGSDSSMCRKNLLTSRSLIQANLRTEADKRIKKVIKNSKIDELHIDSLLALEFQMEHNYFDPKFQENYGSKLDKILTEVVGYAQCRSLYFSIKSTIINSPGEYLDQDWDAKLSKARIAFESTRSSRIGFYYHSSSLLHSIQNRCVQSVDYHVGRLNDVCSKSTCLDSKFLQSKVQVYTEIVNDLFSTTEQKDNSPPHEIDRLIDLHRNDLIILEILYHFCISRREYEMANLIVSNVSNNKLFKPYSTIQFKWDYFLAFVYFKTGKFDRACKILDNLCSHRKGPTILRHHAFVLWFICYWKNDLKRLIIHSDSIERRLSRGMKYLDGRGMKYSRLRTVYEIMENLRRSGFKQEQAFRVNQPLINRLKSLHEPEIAWYPLGCELGRWEGWFQSEI